MNHAQKAGLASFHDQTRREVDIPKDALKNATTEKSAHRVFSKVQHEEILLYTTDAYRNDCTSQPSSESFNLPAAANSFISKEPGCALTELLPLSEIVIPDQPVPLFWPTIQAKPQGGNVESDMSNLAPFNTAPVVDIARYAPQLDGNNLDVLQSLDVTLPPPPGMPVQYVSNDSEPLTEHDGQKLGGKNCRFLQSSTGKVRPGFKREAAGSASVYEPIQKIGPGRGVQHLTMNDHKSGEFLLKLLAFVPIPRDYSETMFWSGCQLDKPQRQTQMSRSLNPNVKRSLLHCRRSQAGIHEGTATNGDIQNQIYLAHGVENPDLPPIMAPPTLASLDMMDTNVNQVNTVSEISDLLNTCSDHAQRPKLFSSTAWNNMLLQNIDGIVQILSIKGTIIYISSSCQQLGYNSMLLIGSSIETICHSLDKPLVMRELENASTEKEIDLVVRYKHCHGGHSWFHNYGSILVDNGRRLAILVGRRIDMLSLGREVLAQTGGLGGRDIWIKLSTSGLVLSVFPNPHPALGMSTDELVGSSLHELMQTAESRERFHQLLNEGRAENTVSSPMTLHSARGHSLKIDLTIYPGKATGTQKPHFLVAKCRLVKNLTHRNHQLTAQDVPEGSIRRHSVHRSKVPHDDLLANFEADRCGAWQTDLNQLTTANDNLRLELQNLEKLAKHRKRSRESGRSFSGCANCHAQKTPEWRRGPSGQRDLCNSCGLKWAKSIRRDQHP